MSRRDNNLPLQLTGLVGREREIAEVGRLLADARLLTLTGPGGSGKTRLALTVAGEVVEEYEDGAWVVELAPLSDPELVPQAVASVLGVREVPGSPLLKTLADHLLSKSMLLVLDNCEHLIDSSASLAEALLRRCPDLSILATSREALGLTGESSWPVPPLSLPDPRHLPAVESLPSYEAARLFIERAVAVEPGFEPNSQNAMAIAQVCYRLDGMPLAIELAAARVRVLSVEQISSRLDDRFGLLTGGGRTALPRQKTLRAAMDWGHELLPERERILFRRLSVFVSGFTLGAAESVCVWDELEREEVLDLLTSLVDKSLVNVADQGNEVRYRLLETIRQYGGEKLRLSGEESALRRRHACFFLKLAEEAEPELKGAQQVEWLDRLEEDHGNLRVAIRWALEEGEIEIALRLTASAAHLRYPRGYLNEGRNQLEVALADGTGSHAARAKALTEVGWFALEQSDYEQAQRLLEESLIMFRELGDTYGVAHALECLVVAKTRGREYGRAAQLGEESLALYRELGHKWGIAMSLTNLGILAQERGEYERATAHHLESLELLRVLGDSLSVGYVLRLLGQSSLMQGQLERSAQFLEESQVLLSRLGDKPTLATTLCNLGETMLRQGDGARAATVYKESLALAAQVGSKATVAGCLEGLGEVALTLVQPARAARLWGAAEALREAIGMSLGHQNRANYITRATLPRRAPG